MGFAGYTEEFIGLGSVAFPLENQTAAESLQYASVGLIPTHRGHLQNDQYVPADIFNDHDVSGVALCWSRMVRGMKPQSGTCTRTSSSHLG